MKRKCLFLVFAAFIFIGCSKKANQNPKKIIRCDEDGNYISEIENNENNYIRDEKGNIIEIKENGKTKCKTEYQYENEKIIKQYNYDSDKSIISVYEFEYPEELKEIKKVYNYNLELQRIEKTEFNKQHKVVKNVYLENGNERTIEYKYDKFLNPVEMFEDGKLKMKSKNIYKKGLLVERHINPIAGKPYILKMEY